jgi:hypothetical protein
VSGADAGDGETKNTAIVNAWRDGLSSCAISICNNCGAPVTADGVASPLGAATDKTSGWDGATSIDSVTRILGPALHASPSTASAPNEMLGRRLMSCPDRFMPAA